MRQSMIWMFVGRLSFIGVGKCLKLAISMHFQYCEVMEKYIRLMIDFEKW